MTSRIRGIVPLIAILTITLMCCKKKNTADELAAGTPNPYAARVKAWFESQHRSFSVTKDDAASRTISGKTDFRDGEPDWEKTKYFNEQGMYVTPMKLGYSNSDLFLPYKYLITFGNKQSDITEGRFLYLAINSKETGEGFYKMLPCDMPAGFFTKTSFSADLSGFVQEFDLDYKPLGTIKIEKGIPSAKPGNLMCKIDKYYFRFDDAAILNAAKVNGGKCTDYYIVETNEETGEILYIGYFYTSCEGADNPVINPTQGGGPGGSSGGNNPPPTDPMCNYSAEQATQLLSTVSMVEDADGTGYTQFGAVTGSPLQPGREERIADPNKTYCNLCSMHFWGDYRPHYKAYFNGVAYRENANDFWKWKTFQYSHYAQDEGIMAPCMNVIMTVSSFTTIAVDKKTSMAVTRYSAQPVCTCLYGIQAGMPLTGVRTSIFRADDI